MAERYVRPPEEPVSQRQTDSTALLPAAAPTGSSDPTDYSVAADGTVIVQAAETLGHYADWSGIGSQALRTLNKLHKNAMVTLGRKVKLDLSRVSAEQFATARREYHRRLQEEYFAGHRDLRNQARRFPVDHRATTCRFARLARGAVQPRCGLQ